MTSRRASSAALPRLQQRLVSSTIRAIRAELVRKANPRLARGAKRFFKEPIKCYGVNAPTAKEIARQHRRELRSRLRARTSEGGGKPHELPVLLEAAEKLFCSRVLEEGAAALELIRPYDRYFSEAEFRRFDRWVDSLSNWAHTDGLSAWLLGPYFLRGNSHLPQLVRWTRSKNRWRRRAAAVALTPAARRGLALSAVLRVAARLMTDDDEMVQKGVGWLLKEASRKHPPEIVRFLLRWRGRTSKLTLRYACEKLSPALRKKVLAK